MDDYSHLVEPSPKLVTKKVRFADDLQSSVDPDPARPNATTDRNNVVDPHPQPLSPTVPSPIADSHPAQLLPDPAAITPSPLKKARLSKDVNDALGYRLGVQKLEAIVTALRSSRDKLFFISFQPKGMAVENWYLVQAQMDTANAYSTSQRDGCLEVLFVVPHYKDSAVVPQRQCRYWPEIHLVNAHLGLWKQMVPISPTKWKGVIACS